MMKAKITAFDSLNPAQRRAATFGTAAPGKGVGRALLIVAGAGTGQDQHPGAPRRASGAERRRSGAHSDADLHAPRRSGNDPPHPGASSPSAADRARRPRGPQLVVAADCGRERFIRWATGYCGCTPSTWDWIPNFTVLDRADAADLIDVIRHELGFSAKDKRFPRKDACLAIYSYRVNTRLSLKQTLEEQFPWCREWEADLTRLYREYVGRKQKNRVLDFDDLLLYWH